MSNTPGTAIDWSKYDAPPQIDFSGYESNPQHDDIRKKYGLPDDADLTSGYLSDKNSKLKMDPVQFSKAYAEANPPPPEAKGFLENMWGEVKDIAHNMFSGGTGTADAPPAIGSSALSLADTAKARYQQAQTDLPGAAGRTATDVAAAALPFLADEAIGGGNAVRSKAGELVYDPATGKIRSPYETVVKAVIPNPYEPAEAPKPFYGPQIPSEETIAKAQLDADAAAMRTRNLQARVAESKAADAAGQTVQQYRAAQKAAAAEAAQPSVKLSQPSGAAKAESEGRPATWTNDTVRELASWGDSEAIEQARLRGFGKIPLKYSTVQTTPKSISLVDPQGRVIDGTPQGPTIRLAPNASGESAASAEAINRSVSEKAAGVKRYRVDTRSGNEIPLIGADAVDAKAGPYDRIVMRDKNGGEITLDEGAKALPKRPKKPTQ